MTTITANILKNFTDNIDNNKTYTLKEFKNILNISIKVSKMGTKNYVFFWKPPNVFSQWTPSKFVVDGIEYCNAEQYMMAEKAKLFGDLPIFDEIMKTSDPKKIKSLGRKVRGYIEEEWFLKSLDIVINGNLHKFQQNPEMLQILLNTGTKKLVEASPYDNIWGIGIAYNDVNILDESKWGKNKLGIALMKVRELLSK